MVLVLSNGDVASVLTMENCMEALEEAYIEEAEGRAVNQLRYDTNMALPERAEKRAYGLAAKYLARKDVSIMGLLGSGWQARFQVAAASIARKLKLMKVYSPNKEHREETRTGHAP
jgi:ornithine cyclodeaminase/alanine dehydrogenase-like protein (mu-crystallin family)